MERNNYIFSYSALQQKKHNILGIGQLLLYMLGVYPLLVMFLLLFSCYIKRLDNSEFEMLLFAIAFIMIFFLSIYTYIYIDRVLHVYIIDNGVLYRLRISVFWYKLREQTYLLNTAGMLRGRLTRLFFMISNIKTVLENITDTVSYEELIAIGKLEKYSDITDVTIKSKSIIFNAKVNIGQNEINKKIRISRVYENDNQIVNYLQGLDYSKEESIKEIVEELTKQKTIGKKIIKFVTTWTAIMLWIAVFLLSSDLSKLSKINAGIYEKNIKEDKIVYIDKNGNYFYDEDYGKMYKPFCVIYGSVLFIYLLSKTMDFVLKPKDDQTNNKTKN